MRPLSGVRISSPGPSIGRTGERKRSGAGWSRCSSWSSKVAIALLGRGGVAALGRMLGSDGCTGHCCSSSSSSISTSTLLLSALALPLDTRFLLTFGLPNTLLLDLALARGLGLRWKSARPTFGLFSTLKPKLVSLGGVAPLSLAFWRALDL
jgi:hypothetical protein